MTLKSLEGQHIFTGVDLFLQDPACVVFELDGNVYEAVENPDDGYRSYMKELEYSTARIRNKIPPTSVVCKHISRSGDEDMLHDLLAFIDAKNGKTFLTIGTKYVNDYYPCCVFEYYPELLSINQQKESDQELVEAGRGPHLVWNVYVFDVNASAPKIYNIFEHENFLSSVLRDHELLPNYSDLRKQIEKELKYYFCADRKWELVISPQSLCKDNAGEKIDIYNQVMLNFDQFYNYLYNELKISIRGWEVKK